MKKIKILLLFLIIACPMQAMAYCTTEDKMRYSSLATNITTSYDYVEKNDMAYFNITIHNVHKDLIILDKQTGKRYSSKKNDLNNFSINNLSDGKSYVFEIYADNSDCFNRLYNTLYVTVPKYNKYYKDPVCSDASDYLYCQKWAEIGNLSYDEFLMLVNNYKNNESEEIVDVSKNEKTLLEVIGDFWAKYYIYISVGIILICVPIIIVKNKKNSFDF